MRRNVPDDENPLERAMAERRLGLLRGGPREPLVITEAEWPDAASIPPRPWLYGTWLQRGQVTMLVADSGVGKTVLLMTIAMEIATGKGVLGHYVRRALPVWYFFLEDPRAEAWRRLEAIRVKHEWEKSELRGRFFLHVGRERRLTIASIGDDGSTVVFPDRPQLLQAARDAGVGLIVVDPAIASHRLKENSTEEMEQAITCWAEIGDELGAAVLLSHHTRKGGNGTIDDGRGAGSQKGAIRVGLHMAGMQSEEAEQLGVPQNERWRYTRVDDGKMNMAPKAEKAWWGRMDMVSLGNATTEYPQGDDVAAMVRWVPPTPASQFTVMDLNAALDKIGAGIGGRLYSGTRRGGSGRWAGEVLVDMLGMTDSQAKVVIDGWLRNGVLEERGYMDPVLRRNKIGVVVVDAKRPG